MPAGKRWTDDVVVALARAVQRRVVAASPSGRARWARMVGRLMWAAGKRRRHVAVANLGYAFPEKSEAERTEIARRSAMHFGGSVVDFMCAAGWTLESLLADATVEGKEHLDEAFAGGKGVLLITGHLGNWERMAAYLSLSGVDLTVIIRDANQEGVNEMVNDMRRASGTKVLPRGDAARPIITTLRKNGMIGILPDQNSEEVFVPFFGQPAGTVLGPGVIRDRTGAAVLPAACFHLGEGKFVIKFYPLLQPVDLPEGKKGEGLMLAVNRWLESAIREHPEQWLWMHDRWRAAKQRGLVR